MRQSSVAPSTYRLRMLPKDLGVALIVGLALLTGWLLMTQVEGRTRDFADPDSPLRLRYPASWNSVGSLQDLLLKVEDPGTPSAFKTTMSVERRELDPASPPTLQTLLDRRVQERSQVTGYHFLSEDEREVAGARAMRSEYAYVVQPIDAPRRSSLPVVVHAREYILVTRDQSYYVTLAAPESEFERASAQFERVLESMVVQ